jgi:glycosyltransferase involved in cell wall biosynthesis
MNVLLVNNQYSAAGGGAETVVLTSQRLLTIAGHTVVPFAIGNDSTRTSPWKRFFPDERALAGRFTRSRPNLTAVYSFEMRRRLRSVLREFRPDVAHLHNVYEKLTLSVLDTLRAHDVPTVMTLHDYRAVCPGGRLLTGGEICHRCVNSGRYWQTVRRRCLEGSLTRNLKAAAEAYLNRARNQYGKTQALVAPSRFLASMLVADGLPSDRIVVIPNPVTLGGLPPEPPNPPLFLFVGRLVAEKGLDDLLTAAAQLKRRCRVAVAGSGRYRGHLEDRIARERLQVTVLGPLPRHELTSWVRNSTAVVLPSLWYENCPMCILEAFAQGVPVIGTDLGGISELVVHERNGLLVPRSDPHALAAAMHRLADDPDLVRQLGRGARATVRDHHRSTDYVRAITACYEAAIADCRRSPRSRPGRPARRVLGSPGHRR